MPFSIALLALALPQATQSAPPKDALALLNEVSQGYADAKSYHIEAVEERAYNNELSRHWDRTLLTAIVMPDGRYRYEGRSASDEPSWLGMAPGSRNIIPTISSIPNSRLRPTIRCRRVSSALT